MPLEDIIKLNKDLLAGRILEVELERKRGSYLYEIEILSPEGRYREFEVDAKSGRILEFD